MIQRDEQNYFLKKVSISKFGINKKVIEEYKELVNNLSKENNEYSIKYYDSFIEDDYYNILMEYGGDVNLKQFIRKYKNKNELIEEKIIKDIILQIIQGIIQIINIKNKGEDSFNPFYYDRKKKKII